MPSGTDPLERVEVEIDGSAFSGWSAIAINIAVDQAARTATLVVSDFVGAMPFRPGSPAAIRASGDLVLTGYLRDVVPSHEEDRHMVRLSIVSKTVDAVECSIDHPTGFLSRKDMIAIAREFDTTEIGIVADEDFPVEPARFVNTGESLFDHLEPLARSYSAFIYDTPDGKLRIAKAPRGRHAGGLAIGEGGNIVSGSATFTEQQRFSPVIVRGQSSKGAGAGALRIEARAEDGGIWRKRPKIVIHESEATSAKLKERAARHVRRASGLSTTADIVVAGWRDAGGMIFEPHFTIQVSDPRLYLDREMAIRSVTLTQAIEGGGEGTRARLELVDPAALNGKAGGKKTGSGAAGSAGGEPFKPSGSIWDPPDPKPTLGAAG